MPDLAALAIDVEQHLLAAGAQRRGKNWRFRCPVHPDQHPSADYAPAKACWVCRSCGAGGGIVDLARRLGLDVPPGMGRRPTPAVTVPPPPPGVDAAPWRDAWLEILEVVREQDDDLAEYRDAGPFIDMVRARIQLVAAARRSVSSLGDCEAAWQLAEKAARIESITRALEADLDAAV